MGWLLLKEFGHHVTHSISKSTFLVRTWHGTCIIWKQGVWVYWGDVISFMSTIIFLLHSLYGDGVGRKQELLLLWRFLREYEFILSHTLHDFVGVGYGTIMGQRGYFLVLEDQEVLPHRKDSPTHRSMMVDDFGIWHVK